MPVTPGACGPRRLGDRRGPRARLAGLALLLAATSAVQAGVKVQIDGLGKAERANVEARLGLRARAAREELTEAQLRRLHAQAADDIREALQPFGYYSPTIEATLEGQAPDWVARYRIDAGPATRVTVVDAAFVGPGADYEPFARVIRKLPLKLGERLRHAEYEDCKKRMTEAAYAGGFLDAQWQTAELRVDPQAQSAVVTLRLQTGPRYYFGPLSIEQQDARIDDAVVARYAHLRPGQPFDPQALLDLQFRLSDLGYYDTVDIEPLRDQADADNRVPVRLTTTPRARTKYNFGVGYGTDTGARLSVGTDWRYLNHYGHTLATDFRLSEIKNTLGGTYRVPLGGKPGEGISFKALTETEQLDAGDTLKYVIGASLDRTPGKWQRKLYLDYTHEESDLGDTFVTADLLTPGLAFTRSRADDPIFARRGWYLFADTHGAVRNVLSNTSFLQGRVLTRAMLPLGKRVRLLGRAEVGSSMVEEFGELPASQRFFAGGDQSVRGYAYQSLGPKDSEGNVVGGRYLQTYSGEIEVRVVGNWGAALFMDAGGADNDPAPYLYRGVGLGLRYRALIGSLQLDLAHPLDGDASGLRLHLGIRAGI